MIANKLHANSKLLCAERTYTGDSLNVKVMYSSASRRLSSPQSPARRRALAPFRYMDGIIF